MNKKILCKLGIHNLVYDTSLIVNEEHIKDFINKTSKTTSLKIEALKVAEILEKIASDSLINNQLKINSEIDSWFKQAYIIRRASLFNSNKVSLEEIFSFCVNGLVCKHTSQIRVLLKNINLPKKDFKDWGSILEFNLMKALILLTRKRNGWSDIEEALNIIKELKENQKRLESDYIKKGQEKVVPNLIVYYNLARIVELTAEYILNGNPANINIKLKKHFDNAKIASKYGITDNLYTLTDKLYIGCWNLIKESILRTYKDYLKDKEANKTLLKQAVKEIKENYPELKDLLED